MEDFEASNAVTEDVPLTEENKLALENIIYDDDFPSLESKNPTTVPPPLQHQSRLPSHERDLKITELEALIATGMEEESDVELLSKLSEEVKAELAQVEDTELAQSEGEAESEEQAQSEGEAESEAEDMELAQVVENPSVELSEEEFPELPSSPNKSQERKQPQERTEDEGEAQSDGETESEEQEQSGEEARDVSVCYCVCL